MINLIQPSRWKRNAVILASIAAVAGAVVLGVAYWPEGPIKAGPVPEPIAQTREDVVQYMASKQFAALPVDQRQDYMQRARQAHPDLRGRRGGGAGDVELTEEQRDQLRSNMRSVMEDRMRQREEEYLKLPPEDRTAYLDKIIDEMQQRMAERTTRPRRDADTPRDPNAPPDANRPAGRGRGFTPQRMRERIETADPAQRAVRAEFRKALQKRMEERGVSFGPGGGGRGPR